MTNKLGKAERAPDREKLLALARTLRALEAPNVAPEAQTVCSRCMAFIGGAAGNIEALVQEELE